MLAPIEESEENLANQDEGFADGEEIAEKKHALAYGNAEELAWDKVFTAESAAAAGEMSDNADSEMGANADATRGAEAVAEKLGAENSEASADAGNMPEFVPEISFSDGATEAEKDTSESMEAELTGFNVLPEAQRANANLSDVLSAHSADEASADLFEAKSATMQEPNSASSADVSIVAPLGVVVTEEAGRNLAETVEGGASTAEKLASEEATSIANSFVAGFMQPSASEAEEAARRARWEKGPESYFDDSEVDLEAPSSRVWSHLGIFFLSFLLIPITWYLLTDASVRLYLVENSPWDTAVVSFAAIFELFGGIVALLLLLILARISSLGAQVFGFILTVAGIIALIVPGTVKAWLAELDSTIGGINAFMGNVVHHLGLDFGSGRIAIFGIVLLGAGLSAHFARRAGAERATICERRKALGLED